MSPIRLIRFQQYLTNMGFQRKTENMCRTGGEMPLADRTEDKGKVTSPHSGTRVQM